MRKISILKLKLQSSSDHRSLLQYCGILIAGLILLNLSDLEILFIDKYFTTLKLNMDHVNQIIELFIGYSHLDKAQEEMKANSTVTLVKGKNKIILVSIEPEYLMNF